jgi:hypothetical protein
MALESLLPELLRDSCCHAIVVAYLQAIGTPVDG